MKVLKTNLLTRSLTTEEEGLAPKTKLTNKYLTIEELSEVLQIPKSWIYERTRKNQIPYKKIGKYLRFHLSEVEEWINKEGSSLKNSTKCRR